MPPKGKSKPDPTTETTARDAGVISKKFRELKVTELIESLMFLDTNLKLEDLSKLLRNDLLTKLKTYAGQGETFFSKDNKVVMVKNDQGDNSREMLAVNKMHQMKKLLKEKDQELKGQLELKAKDEAKAKEQELMAKAKAKERELIGKAEGLESKNQQKQAKNVYDKLKGYVAVKNKPEKDKFEKAMGMSEKFQQAVQEKAKEIAKKTISEENTAKKQKKASNLEAKTEQALMKERFEKLLTNAKKKKSEREEERLKDEKARLKEIKDQRQDRRAMSKYIKEQKAIAKEEKMEALGNKLVKTQAALKKEQEAKDLAPEETPTTKHIGKKNVKDMNPKQNENKSIEKHLNTEVEPVAKLSKFKEREERQKNRLKFGRHKITFRKPSDIAKRAKQLLF